MDGLVLALPVALLVILYTALLRYDRALSDPREPPLISSKIPLFGHVIGLLQYGSAYFPRINSQNPLPIYSMKLFTSKIYVVNSLPLIAAIHRNSKTVASTPFVKFAARCLSGLGHDALQQFDKTEERLGLALDTVKVVEHALQPDRDGADLNEAMLSYLKEVLDEPGPTGPCGLLAWVKHAITQASSRAMYGPLHPLRDRKVEDAFWTFESDAAPLLLGFAPSLVARKAVKARDTIAKSLINYYYKGGLKQGSALARARYEAPAKYGLTVEETAQIEVPFLIALFANSVPTAFWTLAHIFSRPDILEELRVEVREATTSSWKGEARTFTMDIPYLKQKCPLLLSAYQEVLRTHTVQPNTREVLSDTLVNDQYLLKKGSNVQMATQFVHYDPTVWGSDAAEMDLRRFMRKDPPKRSSLAFRTFGGAPNICPGRYFATTEILAAVAFMVMKYDLLPVAGSWKLPTQDQTVFAAVPPPSNDLEVIIKERECWQGEWSFVMGDPKLRFSLASG